MKTENQGTHISNLHNSTFPFPLQTFYRTTGKNWLGHGLYPCRHANRREGSQGNGTVLWHIPQVLEKVSQISPTLVNCKTYINIYYEHWVRFCLELHRISKVQNLFEKKHSRFKYQAKNFPKIYVKFWKYSVSNWPEYWFSLSDKKKETFLIETNHS